MNIRTILASLLISFCTMHAAEMPIRLWPGEAPGEKGSVGEEKDMSKPGERFVAGKAVIRLGNVTDPTIQLFRPAKEKDIGAAVIVAPGGGYNILAFDLEGTEVCEWLNSVGVTGVLLKYRVPARKDRPRHEPAVQDVQRAVSLVRQRAGAWGIDPQRIGLLGFSAGGHAAALASNSDRAYAAADATDQVDHHPNFNVFIYPGYLAPKDSPNALASEIKVTSKTPPAFLAMTQDDGVGVEGALHYALALKAAKVSCELHIYPEGGHGYGLRKSDKFVTTWPDRLADWLKAGGWLKSSRSQTN